jgi:hypothetical protein
MQTIGLSWRFLKKEYKFRIDYEMKYYPIKDRYIIAKEDIS